MFTIIMDVSKQRQAKDSDFENLLSLSAIRLQSLHRNVSDDVDRNTACANPITVIVMWLNDYLICRI